MTFHNRDLSVIVTPCFTTAALTTMGAAVEFANTTTTIHSTSYLYSGTGVLDQLTGRLTGQLTDRPIDRPIN